MDPRSRARMHVLAAAATGVVVLTACGGGGDAGGGGGGGGETVRMELTAKDNAFQPKTLSVPAGAKVVVTVDNKGQAPHTFTSEEVGFDSGSIAGGDTKRVTFTAPDSDTEFICTFHESLGMVGDITVN